MSKIGFGCAALTSLNNRQLALDLLEHAYLEGITHFDVARLYGMGLAENIVGEFAKNKRNKITITSKFGLNPPKLAFQNSGLFTILKKTIKSIPFIYKLAKTRIHAKVESLFTVENAKINLEKSLKELRTDYIDYYLLHEATLNDANSDELIYFLEQQVKEGKILKYGIGSAYSKINNDCGSFNKKYSVFQFENNILHENLLTIKNSNDKLLITHSVFQNIKALQNSLTKISHEQIKGYSDKLNIDLKGPENIGGLLLFHSSLMNPLGLTLFSSVKKEKITNNLKSYNHFKSSIFDKDTLNSFIKLLLTKNIPT